LDGAAILHLLKHPDVDLMSDTSPTPGRKSLQKTVHQHSWISLGHHSSSCSTLDIKDSSSGKYQTSRCDVPGVAGILYRKFFFSSTRELSLQSVGEEELWYIDVSASKSGMDVDEEAISRKED
jgi:hypothetical protein